MNRKTFPEMIELDREYPAVHPKGKLDICPRKLQKIGSRIYNRKTYFTLYCEFLYNLFSVMFWGNTISFLAQLTPFDYIFSIDFSISKTHLLNKLLFEAIELQQRPKWDMFQKALFCTLALQKNLLLNAISIAAQKYLWRDFTFLDKKQTIFGG